MQIGEYGTKSLQLDFVYSKPDGCFALKLLLQLGDIFIEDIADRFLNLPSPVLRSRHRCIRELGGQPT